MNLVKKSPQKTLSISQLYKALLPKVPEVTKTVIKLAIKEVVEIDKKLVKQEKSPRYFLVPNKGGNSFRYIAGGETTRKGTGPYRDIARVIDSDSINITNIFGAPHLNSFDVHAGKSKRGKWGRPDIIVALYRTIGSSRYFSVHAIEYEGEGGFSPANVAQARFGGSGADKCWLLFDTKDWPKNSTQRKNNPSAERVRNFAKELGVGLIYYKNLAHSGTWFVLEEAKQQPRKIEERKKIRHLFEGELGKKMVN